jgi:iron complex outermembrane recepter protein
VFRKDITDFIATFSSVIPDGANNGFNGAYSGYTLRTSTNLGTAQIEGYELNYSQQLTALPKPFDGLSVFGNYTHLKTTGSYDNGATALANFVPETVNAGVSYTLRRVSVQGVYSYKSPYLVSYSPTPISSTYQTVDQTFDAHVQYQFRPWLSAYVDVVNIFNHAPSTYSVDQTRIYIWNVWGTQLTVGFNGRF